ncbi:hypothetical protein [Brytella acorum]|uniref:Uncharacterized protein n=1 Tax=Brytella acorum TaxID=2959299 RepID=A0AA35XX20_9PROT|nr:hypothetical protein [Brytella acorum]MDF3623757.1 hypothetical protein [Brytella acorum]CAI9119824.1 hypothetical protein LMG32879_000650 [Brytella acorum]
MTTKILALMDALNNLVRFRLMPGQCFDSVDVPPLIDGLECDAFISDKAFGRKTIIASSVSEKTVEHGSLGPVF